MTTNHNHASRSVKQVVAALILLGDKVLICQRTRHQPMPLKWEFPGGKIEPNELPHEALRRELDEELGISAVIGEKVTSLHHNYGPGAAVDLHFYQVEQYAGELENRIFREIRWVAPRDLPKYDFLEADIPLIKDLASGKVSLPAPAGSRRPARP
jgi:8-oxo-dGTP diphosphatase